MAFVHINKCNLEIFSKKIVFLHTCEMCFEIPSDINIMIRNRDADPDPDFDKRPDPVPKFLYKFQS